MKNEWVLKTHNQFSVDAANASLRDLKYISRLLSKSDFNKNAGAYPALKRMVAGNVASESPQMTALQPFVISEVSARRAGGATSKPMRVAFVGLTETGKIEGLKFTDPVEAAKRIIPEARKAADVVVVLAHIPVDQALRLATQVAGIDAVISSGGQSSDVFFTPPRQVGETFVAFTPYETRMIGELRFYIDEQGKFSYRARFISLDDKIANDPAGLAAATTATEEEEKTARKAKSALDEWMAKSAPSAVAGGIESGTHARPAYVSSSACAKCHMQQYIQWANTAHVHASDKFVSKPYEFEASCLSCHATGMQRSGAQPGMAKLQGVQCEECHGPGGDHAAKPAKGYGLVANKQALCASCHTAKTSPQFDFQSAWAKVKH